MALCLDLLMSVVGFGNVVHYQGDKNYVWENDTSFRMALFFCVCPEESVGCLLIKEM